MTYKDFFKLISKTFASSYIIKNVLHVDWENGSSDHYEVTWVIGGMTGGSCWGDSPLQHVSSEEEPPLTQLDNFLETNFPNLTFVAYKRIISDLVVEDEYTNTEYYGNYTIHKVKRIDFKQLYDKLVDLSVIDDK